MPRTPRRRVGEGVYRDKYSLTARVQVGSGKTMLQSEQSFEPGTSMKEIQQWRGQERQRLLLERPATVAGSLRSDTARYLEQQEHKESYSAKKSELGAWCAALGAMKRHQIKTHHVAAVIAEWLNNNVAKKTILNRCRTLHHLYVTLAGDKRARTPLDNAEIPRPDRRRPQHVPPSLIVRTEKRLRAAVAAARARAAENPKLEPAVGHAERARARFMVFATTGIRPSQLRRLTREFVDLRRRVVDIGAGKGGEPILQSMNDEQLIAWRAFVEADAWGSYDDSKFRRRLRAAGWPKGIWPYQMKHAVGIALAEHGADHEDIKGWYGHTDTKTVKIYTGTVLKRVRQTAAKLEGRFGWASAPFGAPFGRGPARPSAALSGPKSSVRKTGRDAPVSGRKTKKSA